MPQRRSVSHSFGRPGRPGNYLRRCGSAPENVRRIAVNLGEQVGDPGRWLDAVIGVEAQVAVAPVQRPRLVGLDVPQPRDGQAGPLAPVVFSPWAAPLDDREVSRRHVAINLDLMTCS